MRNNQHSAGRPVNMIFWSIFVVCGVILDVITKNIAANTLCRNVANAGYFEYCQRWDWMSVPVFKGLSWTLAYNEGAAFSFLADEAGWQRWFFIGITVVISVILFFWIRRTEAVEKMLRFGLACVLVGAIGNLIDRVLLGHVIDFIHVYYRDYHFPIFNVADIFVTTGVGFIILSSLTEKKRKIANQSSLS